MSDLLENRTKGKLTSMSISTEHPNILMQCLQVKLINFRPCWESFLAAPRYLEDFPIEEVDRSGLQ